MSGLLLVARDERSATRGFIAWARLASENRRISRLGFRGWQIGRTLRKLAAEREEYRKMCLAWANAEEAWAEELERLQRELLELRAKEELGSSSYFILGVASACPYLNIFFGRAPRGGAP